ncbi:NACHT domain-containing protein [Streptomyces sp. 3N207]|uniref:NACHT domain-containing protein n=1 Tax=Streptomyces sp. 3N207 TaxID=3457417 RepID=UPI003FD5ACA1
MRALTGGSEGRAPVQNTITGGRFGNVVQAARIDALHIHVHDPERELPPSRRLLYGLAALLAGAAAYVAQRYGPLPGLLALASAALTGTAALSRTLERRRFTRPRKPVPAHRLDWTTGQLAEVLTRQYGREDQLALSPVSTPTPLPVRWEAADPAVSEHEANVLGLPAGATESGEPLDVTGEFGEIGAFFTALPRQRLVVLGEPGAGKTVLAYRLARTLLEHRGPVSGAPVPVVLPLASWDPADARGLWHWAAERLSAEQPALLPTPELALDLIESGRLLPVLDGFDELPEPVRADALSELRRSLAAPARCVLTSRVAEYTRALRDAGGLPLPGAAAVRLCPLTAQDLAAYLPRTSGRTDTTWQPVLRRLADPADTAREVRVLRAVLSTPLMVALARVAYSGTDADPAELLGAGRFTIRQAVERHLYDAFFTAAYGRQAEDATRWAGFLAARLREAGRQDLAWWRLDEAVPGAVRALALLPGPAVAALTVHLAGIGTPWWDRWVAAPLWLVLGAGLWLGFAGDALPGGHPRGPQRVRWPRRARPGGAGAHAPLRRWSWWAGGTLYLVALAAALWILGTIRGELQTDAAALAVAGLICLPLTALLVRLRTPADPETAPEPARLLRLDRRSVLALGAVGSGIAKSLDANADFARPRPYVGWVLVVTLGLWQLSGGRDVVTARTWAVVLAGAAVASYLHDFALSAWGRFTLARVWCTCHGQLPWRLMDFLRDAHRRGVLRQAGGVYRFRHIELRNRLAAHAPSRARSPRVPRALRTRVPANVRKLGSALAGALATICAPLFLAASVYGTPKAEPAPFPHGPRPPACSVLSAHDREALMDRPLAVQDGHTKCVAAEQSPFRPAVEVQIRLSADTATASGSGVEAARDDFRERAGFERRNPHSSVLRGPALADQQLRVLGTTFPSDGVPRMRQARYYARDGNLRAYVFYAEEYASARRVSAVAESLLRKALDRPSARDLASIPRTRVPERTRLAGYAREERSLHGAVWQGDEPSRILTFDYVSVPLRAPRQLECDTEYRDEDDAVESTEALDLSAYVCKPPEDGLPARPAPRVRIDLAELECGGRCRQRETRVFERTRPGAEPVRWLRPDGTKDARYAVRKGAESYEMHLLREYRVAPFDRRRLWLRVRVAPEHATLAQKIVNSAYTQAGGGR